MKKTKILTLLLAGTLTFSALAFTGCGEKEENHKESSVTEAEETTEAPKELELPISSDEALKMNYDELQRLFVDAGFKETSVEELNDLDSADDKQNGVIKTVMVDGHESFNKGDKMMSDVKIFIRYHSVKYGHIPVDKYDFEDDDPELNYEDVITQFEKEGFTNITTRAFEDSTKTEGTVKDISVDGESCITDYIGVATVDAKIVITYYTNKENGFEDSKPESKNESKSESETESKADDSEGVSSSFKETMDKYEKFFDDYIEFMKKYKEDSGNLELISEYTKWLSDYSDMLNEMNKIDKDSLSTEDLNYYIEVHTRILEKLGNIE